MESFFSTPLEVRLARHLIKSPEQAALDLFQSVAAEVPVDRNPPKRERIDPARIQTAADFKKLPLPKQNDRLAIQTSNAINFPSGLQCATM
jgi:phenylacetate-coenzyme A ligase PaaK-like adenylate-forming protein